MFFGRINPQPNDCSNKRIELQYNFMKLINNLACLVLSQSVTSRIFAIFYKLAYVASVSARVGRGSWKESLSHHNKFATSSRGNTCYASWF